ncbi:MAG: cyclic pyranopterin monophosphate synthase MoaC [Clostridiales bacterium]|nr:cyclic pyranopterin monophosphate synthase MoaC [Clostridiales bacterium]
MISVENKPVTRRYARARGRLFVSPETLRRVKARDIPKGDPFPVARVAAIQAAKETSRILPLCHPLPLLGVEVAFRVEEEPPALWAEVAVTADARTGVEMEALTGVAAALLSLYDMLKAIDKGMVLGDVALYEKRGGRSGDYVRA